MIKLMFLYYRRENGSGYRSWYQYGFEMVHQAAAADTSIRDGYDSPTYNLRIVPGVLSRVKVSMMKWPCQDQYYIIILGNSQKEYDEDFNHTER